MFQKITSNGYIVSVVSGVARGNITEEEYNVIRDTIQNRPAPPEGFGYRLREDLTWEEYELPPAPPPGEEEAEAADYEEALGRFGA